MPVGSLGAGWLATWQNTPSNPTSTASYWYDGEGQRVAQTLNGTTTYYVGSDEEITGGTLLKYYHIPGLPVLGTITGVTRTYLASDGLGSETVDLSYNGSVLATALYGPYGAGRYSTGTMPTSKGYTGQRQDSGSGLDYYGARYYDALVGQFTSADSVQGPNRYGYVAGNPETYSDPTGHRKCNDSAVCNGTPKDSKACDGIMLDICWSRAAALAPDNRFEFTKQWFANFAPGWGQAETDFMNWMIRSGRMDASPWWQGVDGELIGDMFGAGQQASSGESSSSDSNVQNWLNFMASPTTDGFWTAHNGSIFSAAHSAEGRTWFQEESGNEQVFINDVLVNLRDGTNLTSFVSDMVDQVFSAGNGFLDVMCVVSGCGPLLRATSSGSHACDPTTHCVGQFIDTIYPKTYPAPDLWLKGPFGSADTSYACVDPPLQNVC